ncbi:MAG: hypothetical protein C0627_08835 [Sulfurimonas sp.]|nr:MAG: hypothetical protein C0627_08835 [Sulfurimonas sp.]
MANMEQKTQVLELYTAYFNRVADKDGVDYWLNEMDNNSWTIDMVAITFSQQLEYTNLYGGLSGSQIVTQVYTNVINREADSAGANYWSDELSNGNISVSQLVQAVINAATEKDQNENYINIEDANLFNNKIDVSEYYYNNNLNETNITLGAITKDSSSTQNLKSYADSLIDQIDSTVPISLVVEYETFELDGFAEYGIDGKHLYIIRTDSDGKEYVLEGGLYPEDPINITTRTAELYRGEIGAEPNGYIVKSEDTAATFVNLNVASENILDIWNSMIEYAQIIEDAQIEYVFSPGPNSNSVAAAILSYSGFNG